MVYSPCLLAFVYAFCFHCVLLELTFVACSYDGWVLVLHGYCVGNDLFMLWPFWYSLKASANCHNNAYGHGGDCALPESSMLVCWSVIYSFFCFYCVLLCLSARNSGRASKIEIYDMVLLQELKKRRRKLRARRHPNIFEIAIHQ